MAKDIDKHNLPKMQETLSTIVLSNVYLSIRDRSAVGKA
jgi:hypothetical protein